MCCLVAGRIVGIERIVESDPNVNFDNTSPASGDNVGEDNPGFDGNDESNLSRMVSRIV